MTVGPTLHYSHKNVQRCWFLALLMYSMTAVFWSKILTGSYGAFDIQSFGLWQNWTLGNIVLSGTIIFEYPWQIFVLGVLMGTLAVIPIMISQLMSSRYSLPFIVAVFLLATFFLLTALVAAAFFLAAFFFAAFLTAIVFPPYSVREIQL